MGAHVHVRIVYCLFFPPSFPLSLPLFLPQGLCHSHSNEQTLKDKLKAMKNSFFNSPVPPRLHIDIPQCMADQVLKKDVGPYVFREAQATVFRHLYGYWQDYQAMSHGLSREEIETELNRQREKLRKVFS